MKITPWLSSLALLIAPVAVAADALSDTELAQRDEIEQLKRQMSVLADEVTRLRTEVGVPEEEELKSVYGMGPAASKIYGTSRGLSIGGYAEGVYRNRVGSGDGTDFADFIRAVLYFGYKFNDWIVFNTEIEYEHASTGEDGSVSVEFATLDFLLDPSFNVRAGLLLVPMGYLNEIHEPPFYFGTQRPEPERRIIPSTWRENGAGIFGTLSERLHYKLYVVNGLDATGFDSFGLRGGRQKGSEARAEDLAGVLRVDYDLLDGLQVGGSFYLGDSGQDQTFDAMSVPDAQTMIWEVHGRYERGPFELRALYAHAEVDDARELSQVLGLPSSRPVAEEMFGGYVEAGFDLMQLFSPGSEKSLTPFFRFEYLDTQHEIPRGFTRDRRRPRRLFIPGIQFKPHPNVVLKLDYRNIDDWAGNTSDEISVGMGVAF